MKQCKSVRDHKKYIGSLFKNCMGFCKKISGFRVEKWNPSHGGIKAFIIVFLCCIFVIFSYWYLTGKNPCQVLAEMAENKSADEFLRLISLSVMSLAGLWAILWRNFISAKQINEQIAQGGRVEKQLSEQIAQGKRVETQIALTESKNNTDLLAKACEMAGKGEGAEITGAINLLEIIAQQENGKYTVTAITILSRISLREEGRYAEEVIDPLKDVALLYQGAYINTAVGSLKQMFPLRDGRHIKRIIQTLYLMQCHNIAATEKVVKALAHISPEYVGGNIRPIKETLEGVAEIKAEFADMCIGVLKHLAEAIIRDSKIEDSESSEINVYALMRSLEVIADFHEGQYQEKAHRIIKALKEDLKNLNEGN